MLKKLITASIVGMAVCGVSFGKTGALDIVETALKDVEKQGVSYYCAGDDSHATCYFKDLDNFLFRMKNLHADIWIKDDEVRREISGDIVPIFDGDINKFIPKNFTCEDKSVIKDLQYISNGKCIIESDVATLSIDSNALLESRLFRYKTVPTLLLQYIAKVEHFNNEYNLIQTKYQNDLKILQDEFNMALDDIESNIELLESTQKIANHTSKCDCNSCTSSRYYAIHDEISQKRNDKEQLRKSYEYKYDEIQKQYDEDMQQFTDSVIEWLKQYNLTIKEVRINIKTNNLARSAFETFAKEYLDFNENIPLSKQQQMERNEQKKRITAKYYSSLEASRAAGVTFVEQSPYLEKHLKDSLKKVIVEYAKLLDPNAHRVRVKVVVSPRYDFTINLGDEAKKIIFAYNKGTTHSLIKEIFDIINRYDIKYVRVWPEQ